jgi:fluoroquinolone transport system ATP-binding protein
MIKVSNLSHRYDKEKNKAVNNISFEVKSGEIFGFLGPSGAGKSTTQGVLTGLLPLQEGLVNVAGFDMKRPSPRLFDKIGVSFEQSNVYNKLTALENLEFYKKLFNTETLDSMTLLKWVGLDHVAHKKAGEFSKGMKHRLTFVRSMLNQPELWFLDEPTTGLDPAIGSGIKQLIKERNKKGATVFLTTHNMQVADELCDRIAFIIDGKIVKMDSPRQLKLEYGEKLVEVDYYEKSKVIKSKFSLVKPEDLVQLNDIIQNKKIEMMHTKEATLEEIFIKVTGRGLI